jgi:hypothetical protein
LLHAIIIRLWSRLANIDFGRKQKYNEVMQITWDLFILFFFFILTVYGMLIGKNKIVGILVNIYVALAVVFVFGDQFHSLISNFSIISNNLASSAFGAKMILLVVLAALLTVKSELSGLENSSISKVQGGIYGFLTSGVLLSAAFSFMSNAERVSLNSNFALLVFSYQYIWILAGVLMMIVGGFIRR